MRTIDLGLIPYRDAWQRQEQIHADVLAGGEETLLLLEHPPVITLGRRAADSQKNLLTPPPILQQLGVDLVESDRGGDITLHAPGQLVAYPILRLNDHHLSVGAYVRRLEDVVIATLAEYDIEAFKDESAIGVWVKAPPPPKGANDPASQANLTPEGEGRGEERLPKCADRAAKICALGVRIKRGVTLHGIALNLTTDLRLFNLINPCGLGRPVTSISNLLRDRTPTMPQLKRTFTRQFAGFFA